MRHDVFLRQAYSSWNSVCGGPWSKRRSLSRRSMATASWSRCERALIAADMASRNSSEGNRRGSCRKSTSSMSFVSDVGTRRDCLRGLFFLVLVHVVGTVPLGKGRQVFRSHGMGLVGPHLARSMVKPIKASCLEHQCEVVLESHNHGGSADDVPLKRRCRGAKVLVRPVLGCREAVFLSLAPAALVSRGSGRGRGLCPRRMALLERRQGGGPAVDSAQNSVVLAAGACLGCGFLGLGLPDFRVLPIRHVTSSPSSCMTTGESCHSPITSVTSLFLFWVRHQASTLLLGLRVLQPNTPFKV